MTLANKALVFITLVAAAACKPVERIAALSEDTPAPSSGVLPKNANFFVALMGQPSTLDPTAFRLVAFTSQDIDTATVTFCFDTVATCTSGKGTTLPGLPQDVGDGRKVFLSSKYVKMSAGVTVTVMGKGPAGQDVTQGIKIAAKGSTPPPANDGSGVTPPAPANNNVTPPSTTSDCYKAPSDFVCQVEKECVRLTNEKRKTEGQEPLTFDKDMGYVSRLWSQAQADRGNIGHDWFEAGTWSEKYKSEFKKASPALAENVAMNSGVKGNDATAVASALVEQWWASPGHHANMIGNYSIMSCGYAKGADGSWYGTQNFGN